jgi:HlyD family secretion protein
MGSWNMGNNKRLLAAAAVALSGAAFWVYRAAPRPVAAQPAAQPPAQSPAKSTSQPAEAPRHAVGCLGRLKPEAGVVHLAAPYYQSRPSVVAELLAHEGEWVRKGQVIAYLDGKAQVEAERARVAAQLELSRARVAQARAGAKPSDVEAQRSEIASLEASYRLRDSEYKRYQALSRTGDASAADLESRHVAFETAGKSLEEARHRLAALNEVRAEDVRVAEADAAVAAAQLRETEAQLAALTVTAPAPGRVIKIHSHSGEQAGADGILEIADTAHMAAEAEVYASDIGSVRIGQRATVELEGGGAKLTGVVTRLGSRVQQAEALSGDPSAYSDARVVPVEIRVSGCPVLGCPINARVKVVIEQQP